MSELPDPGVFGGAFEQFMRAMSLVAEHRRVTLGGPAARPSSWRHKGVAERRAQSLRWPQANLQLALDAVLADAELVGFTPQHAARWLCEPQAAAGRAAGQVTGPAARCIG
jgi:hypothetical protein